MPDSSWYVRLGEDELGPLTSKELEALAQQGAVNGDTPLSSDRQAWQKAGAVEGLAFGRAPTMPGVPGQATNEWVEASKAQAKTILEDLRKMDFHKEIIPIDETNLATLLKDGIFWFATLLGIVPLMIGTLTNTHAQVVVFALFFAAVWGVIFRSAILKDDTNWKILLAALFFTGVAGTLVAARLESAVLPQDFPEREGYVTSLLKFVFVVGLCEELCKLAPVIAYLLWKRTSARPMTMVLVGVFSGLGFAAFENLTYSQMAILQTAVATDAVGIRGLAEGVQGAVVNGMLRSLSCVFCHAVWAGIFAYFLAIASISRQRLGALFLVGMALTVVLHGSYDWFLSIQPTMAALTAGFSFVLFYAYVAKLRKAVPLALASVTSGSTSPVPGTASTP